MANILKLQDQLKGLPDNALIQYAQNPTGQVPQYLVLSELQRRKSMREEYQQSQAQQPQSTVAQDLTQPQGIQQLQPQPQSQPQPQPQPVENQGVANLPIPDTMFNEKTMAGGGIVAFDEGGSVPGYAAGGGIEQKIAQLRQIIDNPNTGLTARLDAQNELQAITKQVVRPMVSARGPARPEAGLSGIPAYMSEQQTKFANLPKPYGYQEPATGGDYAMLGNMVSDLPSATLPFDTNQKQPPTAAGPSATGPGIPSLTVGKAPVLPTPTEFNPTPLETETSRQRMLRAEDKYGEDAIRARQKRLREEAGIKDIYADQLTELGKEREALKGDKEKAGWTALMEAGLATMAGTSPFALQNIGAGALKGVGSYKDAVKELKQNERDLRREANTINREQQNVLEARVRGDQDAVDRGRAIIDSATNNYERKVDANAVIQNSALQFNIGKKFDRDLAQFSSDTADFRLNKQLVADAAKHNQLMQMYENRIKASDKAAAARLMQNRIGALREMNKDPDYQRFLDSLDVKYKKQGGATNPQYQFEKQMFVNRYLSDALGLLSDGASGVQSADDLLGG